MADKRDINLNISLQVPSHPWVDFSWCWEGPFWSPSRNRNVKNDEIWPGFNRNANTYSFFLSKSATRIQICLTSTINITRETNQKPKKGLPSIYHQTLPVPTIRPDRQLTYISQISPEAVLSKKSENLTGFGHFIGLFGSLLSKASVQVDNDIESGGNLEQYWGSLTNPIHNGSTGFTKSPAFTAFDRWNWTKKRHSDGMWSWNI